MGGWKTWTGSIGLFFTGGAIILNCVSSGDYSRFGEGLASIFTGIASLGIGHKIEKTII